jgi:hypothetical protein
MDVELINSAAVVRGQLREAIVQLRHALQQEIENARDVTRVIFLRKKLTAAVGDYQRHEVALRERFKFWNTEPCVADSTAQWMNQPIPGRMFSATLNRDSIQRARSRGRSRTRNRNRIRSLHEPP